MERENINRIESVIMQEVEGVVSGRLFDVRSTLKSALRAVVWPAYEHREVPEEVLYKLDALVDLAFDTTRRAGPEGETWPELDKKQEKVVVEEIQDLLKLRRKS